MAFDFFQSIELFLSCGVDYIHKNNTALRESRSQNILTGINAYLARRYADNKYDLKHDFGGWGCKCGCDQKKPSSEHGAVNIANVNVIECQVTDVAEVEVTCRIHTPLAENQKSESRCLYIVFSDMAGTTICMIRGTPNEPFLSPMPLADRHLTENEYIANFVTDSDLGLETRDDYPYDRRSRHYKAWNDQRYRERGHIRYYLTRICRESKDIKPTLVHHFLGNPDNLRFPVAADIYTGRLTDSDAAAERAAVMRVKDCIEESQILQCLLWDQCCRKRRLALRCNKKFLGCRLWGSRVYESWF